MDKFDSLIRQGDIKAIRYFANEYYYGAIMGYTRKCLIERVADNFEKLEQENNQLRDALMKCSPWEVYIPENCNIWMPCCKFCRHISVPDITLQESIKYHTDDCEYVRLTEGREWIKE